MYFGEVTISPVSSPSSFPSQSRTKKERNKKSLEYAKIGNISEFVTDSLNMAPSQRSPTLDRTPSASNKSLRHDGEKPKISDTYICTLYGNEKELKPKIRPRLTPTRWALQRGGQDCVGSFRKSHQEPQPHGQPCHRLFPRQVGPSLSWHGAEPPHCVGNPRKINIPCN